MIDVDLQYYHVALLYDENVINCYTIFIQNFHSILSNHTLLIMVHLKIFNNMETLSLADLSIDKQNINMDQNITISSYIDKEILKLRLACIVPTQSFKLY